MERPKYEAVYGITLTMHVLKQVHLATIDRVGARNNCSLCENFWKGAGLMSYNVSRSGVSCQAPSSLNMTLPVKARPREGAHGAIACMP